jgi:hypothetical protein
MEDPGDIQMRMAFAKLKQFSEAEYALQQLRLETYRALLGSRR